MKGQIMKLNEKQLEYVNTAYEMFSTDTIEKSQIKQVNAKLGMKSSPAWLIKDPQFRLSRGVYRLPVNGIVNPSKNVKQEVSIPEVKQKISKQIQTTESATENLVPNKEDTFVPFGNYKDIKNIVKSGIFYPTFITGLSGNGKTLGVQQSCAELKREMIRVNITIETDEDDLLGGFRLQDGETVWHDGPVVNAMKKGAVLLLDEIDLASNKIMCLQPILEGNGIFLKKIGQFVEPKDGFQIFATANTKGKGSDDGRFIGTNILNEAFLERFAITIEQPYPASSVEKKIVLGAMKKYGKVDEDFATNLVTWSEVIRKTFFDGGVDEVISTRRLDHIVKAFAIFSDKMKSIELCVARFDEDTKASFMDLYTKIDAGIDVSNADDNNVEEETDDEAAF